MLFGLHGNVAVHHLDDRFGDRHTQAGAAVSVGGRRIFLAEHVENARQVLFVHTNSSIPDDESERGVSAELRDAFNGENNIARRRRKLDGVAQNIYQHLLKLHGVANVKIVDPADNFAVVVQALFGALPADHRINLLNHVAEGKFLVLEHHFAGLNAAHVKNIVDKPQQVAGAVTDFAQVFTGTRRQIGFLQRDTVETDYSVHRRANFVAHAGQEGGFGDTCLIGGVERVFELIVAHNLFALNFGGVRLQQNVKFGVFVNQIENESLVENFVANVAGDIDFVGFALGKFGFDGFKAQGVKIFLNVFVGAGKDGLNLPLDVIVVVAGTLFRENAALDNSGRVADNHAVIAVDEVSYHVVLADERFVQNGVVDNFGVVVAFQHEGNKVAVLRIFAERDVVFDETFAPVRTLAEQNFGERNIAAAVAFKKFFDTETLGEFFSVAFERESFSAMRKIFSNAHALQVDAVQIFALAFFDDVFGKVEAQGNQTFAGNSFEFGADALIKILGAQFVFLNGGDVEIVAVGVPGAAVVGEGIVNVDPNPVALERALANVEAVGAGFGDVVFEKVSDFGAVVGVNAVHGAAAFQLNKFGFSAFNHF